MKVLLELLGDTTRILNGVEGLDDFRPEGRERVRELLQQLRLESTRILETADDDVQMDEKRQVWLRDSLEAITSKEYDTAREALEQAVEEFPEDFEFLNYLGLVCWEQEDLRDAEEAYHRAVRTVLGDRLCTEPVEGSQDEVLRAVEGRALALYRLGDLDDALTWFQWLGDNYPDSYVGCSYLAGEIHHLRGELDRAIERYEQVPVEPAVLYNRGLAHFQRHELDEAVHHWIRGLVANVHIGSMLLGRQAGRKSCTPGHLGSRGYAKDFVDACLRLWHGADGGLRFLDQCFSHEAVQQHLDHCSEEGGTRLLQSGEGAMGCAGWLEQLQDQAALDRLVSRVTGRLRM